MSGYRICRTCANAKLAAGKYDPRTGKNNYVVKKKCDNPKCNNGLIPIEEPRGDATTSNSRGGANRGSA
jgi:hypothetical protein